MLDYTFHGMSWGQLSLWFFIYSFIGWAMECVVIRKQLGRWENRGFAKMPFCVIYGFGVYIALHIFAPIQDNYVALYIFGALAATAFEYLTAVVMLKLFGEVWWNYDHLPFNYKGILCLQSTLGWGIVALIVFGFLNDVIEGFVLSLDSRVASAIGGMLLIMYLIDFTYNFAKRLMNRASGDEFQEDKEESEDNSFSQLMTKIKRK